MDDNSLGCSNCGKSLDVRELISKSLTVDNCPSCGSMVRKTEGFGSTNLMAVIAGDIAAIDEWLNRYSIDTGHTVVKRDPSSKNQIRWSVGSTHRYALECVYDESKTGFVQLRGITKDQAETMFSQSGRLSDVAAKHGIQPCGERHSGWNMSDGSSTDGYWGVVQYLNVNTLSSSLLVAVGDRFNAAISTAKSELLGDHEE